MTDKARTLLKQGAVMPAMPLVLNESRKFDEAGQRTLIRYYLDSGIGGLGVGIHTTQFEIRDPEHDLFETVLSVVMDEIKKFEKTTGKTIIKVGGACGKTSQAVKEAALLNKLGYDAALLSPSGIPELTDDDMIERTKAVATELSVFGFFLQPATGGRVHDAMYWKKMADIPELVAIKCAPFNRYQTHDMVRGVVMSDRRDEIALYTGNDDTIILDLLSSYSFNIDGKEFKKRFVGGLLGHWAVWTKNVTEMFERIKAIPENGPIPLEFMELAAKVTDANAAFFDAANNYAGCRAGLHEVLKRQGLMKGIWCLDPNEGLSKGQLQEIDRVIETYPELNDDAFVKENLSKWL